MKLYKISLFAFGVALLTASCTDMDEQFYEGGSLTPEQRNAAYEAVPSRVDASFSGMYNLMANGGSGRVFPNSPRHDDFGFVMAAISLSLEGADAFGGDNGYNWFSTASEYSDRDPNYANPYIRYTVPYRQAGVATELINSLGEMLEANPEDTVNLYKLAQAHAIRAFDYMALAPYFAGNYQNHQNDLCIPLLGSGADFDFSNNPRATVKQVYEQIIKDLNFAVDNLKGFDRGVDYSSAENYDDTSINKMYIDRNVAFGLRARANLYMGNWAAAAADADSALAATEFAPAYEAASMADVSVPAFCQLKEKNWMWGILITKDQGSDYGYRTSDAWVSAFTGDGYGPATGNVPVINKLLYDKINATDVRKGWWLDATKHSDNWANITWVDTKTGATAKGDDIADYVDEGGAKIEFEPYTNIKFGMKDGIASATNCNDWPLMRAEEMILIKAEGLAKSGNEGEAKTVLENFVKNYRDPGYSVALGGRSLADEIWFQRRVELWMEGFSVVDARRLEKPIVRVIPGRESNVPAAFKFNIAPDNAWLNMRFPQTEVDANHGIVDNEGGTQPQSEEGADLRDGVTD